jgi:hypothetical protein
MFALWIGFYRQLVAPGVVFWVLTRSLDFGLMAIWWGIFSITWSAALFTLFFVRRTINGLPNPFPGEKPTPGESPAS